MTKLLLLFVPSVFYYERIHYIEQNFFHFVMYSVQMTLLFLLSLIQTRSHIESKLFIFVSFSKTVIRACDHCSSFSFLLFFFFFRYIIQRFLLLLSVESYNSLHDDWNKKKFNDVVENKKNQSIFFNILSLSLFHRRDRHLRRWKETQRHNIGRGNRYAIFFESSKEREREEARWNGRVCAHAPKRVSEREKYLKHSNRKSVLLSNKIFVSIFQSNIKRYIDKDQRLNWTVFFFTWMIAMKQCACLIECRYLSFSLLCTGIYSSVNKRNQIWLLSKYFIIKFFFSCWLFMLQVNQWANIQWKRQSIDDIPSFFVLICFFFRFGSDPVKWMCWWNKQESE